MLAAASNSPPTPGQKLIAPVWHTALLVSIFLGVTIAGALFQRHAQSSPGMLQQHPNVVPLYLSVIAVEWFLVYGVWRESEVAVCGCATWSAEGGIARGRF